MVDDLDVFSVAAQQDETDSFLELTKKLVAVRRASPALRTGSYGSMEAKGDVLVFERHAGDDRSLVVLNFSESERSTEIPSQYKRVEISTQGMTTNEVLDGHLQLAPLEGYIVGKGRIT
jgi:alpha-glucosidase